MPSEIHALMENAHNQHTVAGLAIKYRMTGGFDLSVARPDIACFTSEVGKCRQYAENFMQNQNVLFGLGKGSAFNRGFSNCDDVGIGLGR